MTKSTDDNLKGKLSEINPDTGKYYKSSHYNEFVRKKAIRNRYVLKYMLLIFCPVLIIAWLSSQILKINNDLMPIALCVLSLMLVLFIAEKKSNSKEK